MGGGKVGGCGACACACAWASLNFAKAASFRCALFRPMYFNISSRSMIGDAKSNTT
jgi:hypothetical protein